MAEGLSWDAVELPVSSVRQPRPLLTESPVCTWTRVTRGTGCQQSEASAAEVCIPPLCHPSRIACYSFNCGMA